MSTDNGYTWVPEQPDEVLWDTDLDAPATSSEPPANTRIVGRAALVLLALAAGALSGALIAPPSAPRPPPSVSMTVQDAFVTDHPVVSVRLAIGNAGDRPARLTGLVVEGAGNRIVAPLDVTVAPRGSAVAVVDLTPKCPGPVDATRGTTAHAIAPSEARGTVAVSLTRALAAVNGLCVAFDTRLPAGWQGARRALGARTEGQDLVVTVSDLSADRLEGILVDDQLLPTVFVGNQLLTTTAKLTPGANTVLRLKGPPPCIGSTAGAPAPTTMRLLARGDDSLVQQVIVVGPELTRWIRSGCDRLESESR